MLSKFKNKFKSYLLALKRLLVILDPSKKHVFYWILFTSIIVSGIEVVGISILMPFISLATDYEVIQSNHYYKIIYDYFEFKTPTSFVMFFGLSLILFYFVRSIINLTYVYYLRKFVEEQYLYFANNLFYTYMWLKYKDFTQKNSSNMTKIIMHESAYAAHFIQTFMMVLSEFFILILIYTMLMLMSLEITLFMTLIFSLSGLFLIEFSSKKIKRYGDLRAGVHTKYYEILNRNFGDYKVIKVFSGQADSIEKFKNISSEFVEITIKSGILQELPKYFLESVGFIVLVLVVLFFTFTADGHDISAIIPLLSVFVLGLYRMLPSINKLMTSFNTLLIESKAVQIIIDELSSSKEILGNQVIEFKKEIKFVDLTFEYELRKPVLKNINFQINKGEKIGLIGESGGGKSTLVSLLMGLHKPTSGILSVDDTELSDDNLKSWRSKIGYIPQSIYLFDGTIAENIVFGREYDEHKIVDVLKKAHIYNFLMTKEGLNTYVGEGGILLSGGQKQRIAIARALYGDPEILILDEATSALDSETEENVMKEVYEVANNMTLILIAHRLSTLMQCDKIYKIETGKIILCDI